MTVRLVQILEHPAEACFEAFCDAESIPQWVAPVESAAVRERDAEGRPVTIDFVSTTNTGARLEYGLVYTYDDTRVTWRAEHSTTDGVRGYATFVPRLHQPGSCMMTYVLNYGPDWKGDFLSERERAQGVLDTFAAFLAARRESPRG